MQELTLNSLERVAMALGLEASLRPLGRPRKETFGRLTAFFIGVPIFLAPLLGCSDLDDSEHAKSISQRTNLKPWGHVFREIVEDLLRVLIDDSGLNQ